MMEITYRPQTAQEAWDYMLRGHANYHKKLKHFGYGYEGNIPNHPMLMEIYGQEHPTEEQVAECKELFFNEIYNEADLRRLDPVIEQQGIPGLLHAASVLEPVAKAPEHLRILTAYGHGGTYDHVNRKITFRMAGGASGYPEGRVAGLLQHEYIHILIEQPVIIRHGVPQNLKERIVDIIGAEYFGIPVQKRFVNKFVDGYITREAVENDLPGAVGKMMAEHRAVMARAAGRESL